MKTKKAVIYEVEYDEVERAIAEFYQMREVNLLDTERWPNNSRHSYIVKREPLDKWDAHAVSIFRDYGNRPLYVVGCLLQDMCSDGSIKPGRYYINVSW